MKKIKLMLMYFIILFTIYSCDYSDYRLKIKNNTSFRIVFCSSQDTIPDSRVSLTFLLGGGLLPNEECTLPKTGSETEWSNYIFYSINKRLNFYVYIADTLKKYNDMDYINKNKLYFKEYHYTEHELDSLKWFIVVDNSIPLPKVK